jgi:ComF family protein
MNLFSDFISLFYPRYCAACGNSLWKHEEVVCTRCDFHLPRTNFHLELDNPVSRLFWGRAKLKSAAAFYYFHKGNRVQHLVHELKYKGRKDIGIYLGRQYGSYLKNSPFFNSVDIILPVPLHKKKLMQRGYNQSEQFALGLMAAMKIPLDTNSLIRTRASETQTRKARFSRWENVSGLFYISDPGKLAGKHILLVDDVITTGSTIESCTKALLSVPGSVISVAAIAASLI